MSIFRSMMETEDYVPVPPELMSDPFYRITHLVKQEIRKHKWIRSEKGESLTWAEARESWATMHFRTYERFFREAILGESH